MVSSNSAFSVSPLSILTLKLGAGHTICHESWLTEARRYETGLRSRCRKESEVFGWSRNRIPKNSRSRCRSRILCPTLTPDVQLNHFLHHTPELGIPIEMVQIVFKLLLKQWILALYHNFHWLLVATRLLTAKLHSRYVKESQSGVRVGNYGKVEIGVGVGDFNSDSATMVWKDQFLSACNRYCHGQRYLQAIWKDSFNTIFNNECQDVFRRR